MYAFSPDVYIFDFRRLVYIGVTVNYNLTNLNKLVSDYWITIQSLQNE